MSAPVGRVETVRLGFAPWPHQRAAHALRKMVRFLVLVWHRRAGKTLFCINELGLAALQCAKPNGRYGYIAPLLSQAKTVAWTYLRAFGRSIPGAIIKEGELTVMLPNGASIRLFGADNPESFRGLYFDGVVVDEVADIKPKLWGEILRPALMDRQGWAIFIGTPKGVNLFSQLYYDALKGEDGWGADLKRHSDTGCLPAEEIEAARTTMTEAQWAQEMECDFAAAVDDALIKLSLVLEAQQRTMMADQYHYAAKVLGVDCARYGNDRSAFTMRQGLVAHPATVMKHANTTQVAQQGARIADAEHPDAIFIDVGGVGAGVFDQMVSMGYDPIPVDFGSSPTEPRFQNKRAEMWWEMAEWLKLACIPNDTELATDLTAPRFTYKNAKGKFQLESKDDMRARGMKSPDKGDSLATTFFAPVVPKHLRRAASSFALTKYDWRTGKPQ